MFIIFMESTSRAEICVACLKLTTLGIRIVNRLQQIAFSQSGLNDSSKLSIPWSLLISTLISELRNVVSYLDLLIDIISGDLFCQILTRGMHLILILSMFLTYLGIFQQPHLTAVQI